MTNRYSAWKYLLVTALVVFGIVYALPNLYGEDPAVQVSARNGELAPTTQDTVESLLRAAGVTPKAISHEQGRLLVRFADTDSQLEAQDAITDGLDRNHIVALNLAPSTPDWLSALNAAPMYLGLDLRGGVHFLLQVDMEAAIAQAMERYAGEMRTFLRDERIRYNGIRNDERQVTIRFNALEQRQAAIDALENQFNDLEFAESDQAGTYLLNAALTDEAVIAERKAALEQNIITLRNRVNELGVAEPIVQQQGDDQIVVQLPGVQDTARAKEILGATATLEFRLTSGTASDWFAAANEGKVPVNARLYRERDGNPVLLQRQVIVTGDQIKDAASGFDNQSGSPAVFVTLDGAGAAKMQKISADNIGKPMAVVFIENRVEREIVDGEEVRSRQRIEEVINIATIRDVLSHRFQITGLDSGEARNLALLLRAGALKAPVEIVEERTVGPSLGQDNIDQGFDSVLVGFSVVLIFMAIYYKIFGLVANVALCLNLVLIIAVLSMLQATLTMPGIAGIVLTVGMAVDANVLIFERIREELRNGNSIQASIHAGYEKAFTTIADANVTTLIAAIVLFSFGTGPIKGFAVTLSIGIVTSMFTAIMGTRAVVNLLFGGKRLQKLAI